MGRTRRGRGLVISSALLAAMTLTPGLTPVATGQVEETDEAPLNVVIIVTDDQRARGSMQVMPKTQALFGSAGTAFTSAYATTPTCCPSRSSIFTGRYSHNHGVHTSAPGQAQMLDQATTIQRYLAEAGYLSGLFGKYLNGWPLDVPPPFFDRWATRNHNPKRSFKDGRWSVNGTVEKVKSYATYFLGDQAVEFISEAEESDERPFFLYLSPHAPHAPSIPARRHQGLKVGPYETNPATEEADLSDKPDYVAESAVKRSSVSEKRRRMLRSLMAVDDIVEQVFRKLEKAGELDNTIAFFLSDNGYLLGEHQVSGKRFPYLESVAIPFYVRWPERFEAGAIDDRLVGTIDIAPTIFEAIGIDPDHTLDGRSLLDSGTDRQRLLLEHWDRQDRVTPDWAAFVTDNSQYVEYYLAERLVVTEREYYDLTADPWQTLNLFGDGNPANDPDVTFTSLDLARAVSCIGTSGTNPCP